jgi:hypothetical protein
MTTYLAETTTTVSGVEQAEISSTAVMATILSTATAVGIGCGVASVMIPCSEGQPLTSYMAKKEMMN